MLNQGNIDINVFHLFNTVHNPMKSRSLLKLLKESQGNQKYYNWDFR